MYTTGGGIKGMHAIFVLISLESKSLFKSMLEKYTAGGWIKGMRALFVFDKIESKYLFGSMLEKNTTGGTMKGNRRGGFLTADDGKRVFLRILSQQHWLIRHPTPDTRHPTPDTRHLTLDRPEITTDTSVRWPHTRIETGHPSTFPSTRNYNRPQILGRKKQPGTSTIKRGTSLKWHPLFLSRLSTATRLRIHSSFLKRFLLVRHNVNRALLYQTISYVDRHIFAVSKIPYF